MFYAVIKPLVDNRSTCPIPINTYMTLALDRSNGVLVALMTDGDTNTALNNLSDGWSIV